MNDNFSFLTPNQAGVLVGCSGRTLLNYIKSGKLSATREDGKWYIDKSELFRVFPEAFKRAYGTKDDEEIKKIKESVEIEFLRKLIGEREELITYLKDQIESSKHEKGQIIEALNSQSRLLEHQQAKEEKKKTGWVSMLGKKK